MAEDCCTCNVVKLPSELQPVKGFVETYVQARLQQLWSAVSCQLRKDGLVETQCDDLLARATAAIAQAEKSAQLAACGLSLMVSHDCRSSGCGAGRTCALCQFNPSRPCSRNTKPKYLEGETFKAACDAPLRIMLVDSRTGDVSKQGVPPSVLLELHLVNSEKYEEYSEPLTASQLRECIRSEAREGRAPLERKGATPDEQGQGRLLLQLEDGCATLTDIVMTCSSAALLGGRGSSFRLLVWAVDALGQPVAGITHAVSESFVVATRRVRATLRPLFPLLSDPVTKLEHVGKATADKLRNLDTALQEAGASLQLPMELQQVTTVRQCRQLLELVHGHRELENLIRTTLKLAPEAFEELRAHASVALEPDSRQRVWWRPDRRLGLVYGAEKGAVRLHHPVGVVTPSQPSSVVALAEYAHWDELRLQLDSLKVQASQAWRAQAHPGWEILAAVAGNRPPGGQASAAGSTGSGSSSPIGPPPASLAAGAPPPLHQHQQYGAPSPLYDMLMGNASKQLPPPSLPAAAAATAAHNSGAADWHPQPLLVPAAAAVSHICSASSAPLESLLPMPSHPVGAAPSTHRQHAQSCSSLYAGPTPQQQHFYAQPLTLQSPQLLAPSQLPPLRVSANGAFPMHSAATASAAATASPQLQPQVPQVQPLKLGPSKADELPVVRLVYAMPSPAAAAVAPSSSSPVLMTSHLRQPQWSEPEPTPAPVSSPHHTFGQHPAPGSLPMPPMPPPPPPMQQQQPLTMQRLPPPDAPSALEASSSNAAASVEDYANLFTSLAHKGSGSGSKLRTLFKPRPSKMARSDGGGTGSPGGVGGAVRQGEPMIQIQIPIQVPLPGPTEEELVDDVMGSLGSFSLTGATDMFMGSGAGNSLKVPEWLLAGSYNYSLDPMAGGGTGVGFGGAAAMAAGQGAATAATAAGGAAGGGGGGGGGAGACSVQVSQAHYHQGGPDDALCAGLPKADSATAAASMDWLMMAVA